MVCSNIVLKDSMKSISVKFTQRYLLGELKIE